MYKGVRRRTEEEITMKERGVMTKTGIVISDSDEKKLKALIRSAQRRGFEEKQVIEKLEAALRSAVIL